MKALMVRQVKVYLFVQKSITSSFKIADSFVCICEQSSLRKIAASRRLHSNPIARPRAYQKYTQFIFYVRHVVFWFPADFRECNNRRRL